MNTSGDWQQEAPRWPGAPDPTAPAAAWAVGLDTLARASSVAVTATDERAAHRTMGGAPLAARRVVNISPVMVVSRSLGGGKSERLTTGRQATR